MSIIQAFSDFLDSLINRNSPEVQKRLQMKKLENDLRAYQPNIFKNGNLLPNFAEAIRILYVNTKPLNELFSATIGGSDVPRAHRFEAQLVLTGFSIQDQEIIESLSYDNRKADFDNQNMTTSQIFDRQRRKYDRIIQILGTEPFAKIDRSLINLHQLCDFCKFNFVTILQIFDPNFISSDSSYKPSYQEISAERLLSVLEDLYFQMAGLKLTNAMINAVSALASMKSAGEATFEEKNGYASNMKTIAYVINHILSPEKLKALIKYAKQDNDYTPSAVSYKESARKNFEAMLSAKFTADEQRIKTEMKDENIRSELSLLFGNVPLQKLYGYNLETSQKMMENSQNSFLWILPLQIIKSFLITYFTEQVRSLLNDIVIEGFFNNPTFKTEFSADIYAAFDTIQQIKSFEESFVNSQNHSIPVLEGYINDGKNNPDFLKRLDQTIIEINSEASKLIAKITNTLNKLYKHLGDLIADSKKPTSEIISNLKVLMMSSRNRDNTDLMEQQYPKWEIFFKIMKNYAIING